MIESASFQTQCRFQRRDHLGATGMAGEAIDRRARHSDPRQDAVDRWPNLLLGEGRDRPIEDDAQSRWIDLPAHDVERVGPQMFARAFNEGEASLYRTGTYDAGRRAIAEECGRHHVGRRQLIHAEGGGADLDGDQQHSRAGPRRGQTAGQRQARDAAGASEPEHRHPLDISAKAHAPGDAGLEARRRDAGRGDGDDRVDLGRGATRRRERTRRGVDEQFLRALEIGGITFGPAQGGEIPVERLHRVARFDAGRREDRRHPLEGGIAMGKNSARCRFRLGLEEPVRRQGVRDGEQGDRLRQMVFLPLP